MGSMTTTIVQSKKSLHTSGFTLIEVLVSLALLSLIISVGLTALTFISQSSTSLTNLLNHEPPESVRVGRIRSRYSHGL